MPLNGPCFCLLLACQPTQTHIVTHAPSALLLHADINACINNQCTAGTGTAICTDKPAPALDNADGRNCTCVAVGATRYFYSGDTNGCTGEAQLLQGQHSHDHTVSMPAASNEAGPSPAGGKRCPQDLSRYQHQQCMKCWDA